MVCLHREAVCLLYFDSKMHRFSDLSKLFRVGVGGEGAGDDPRPQEQNRHCLWLLRTAKSVPPCRMNCLGVPCARQKIRDVCCCMLITKANCQSVSSIVPMVTVDEEGCRVPMATVNQKGCRVPMVTVEEGCWVPMVTVDEEGCRVPMATVNEEGCRVPMVTVNQKGCWVPMVTVNQKGCQVPMVTVDEKGCRVPMATVDEKGCRVPCWLTVS